MDVRKKLIELLGKAHNATTEACFEKDLTYAEAREIEADHLIANGVTIAEDKNVLTNADRIRAMSDEELARILYDCDSLGYCNSPPECGALLDTDKGIPEEKCIDCVLKWLRQPVKEEATCTY